MTDHALGQARQWAVIAIAAQKQRLADEANQAIAALDQALRDLAAVYAREAGLEGTWTFGKDAAGAVVLRQMQVKEPEKPGEAEVEAA